MITSDSLSSLFAAAVTPLSEDGAAVNFGAIGPLLDYLGHRGVEGVLALGSTGEFASLTMEERRSVLTEVFASKGGMKVIAGCGASALPEVVELIRLAQKRGAVAVLVPPPFYFRTATPDGLERFFSEVLTVAELPVILYHVPALTGIPLDRKMIERLTRFETLWGIKDTGGKIQDTVRYLSHPPARVLLGSDTLLHVGLKAGIQGAISACANILPELVSSIVRLYREGKDVEPLQKKLTETREALRSLPYHAALKRWLHLDGVQTGGVRAPLMNLTNDDGDLLSKIMISQNYRR